MDPSVPVPEVFVTEQNVTSKKIQWTIPDFRNLAGSISGFPHQQEIVFHAGSLKFRGYQGREDREYPIPWRLWFQLEQSGKDEEAAMDDDDDCGGYYYGYRAPGPAKSALVLCFQPCIMRQFCAKYKLTTTFKGHDGHNVENTQCGTVTWGFDQYGPAMLLPFGYDVEKEGNENPVPLLFPDGVAKMHQDERTLTVQLDLELLQLEHKKVE